MTTMPPQKHLTTARLLATASLLKFRAMSRDRSGSTLGVLINASGAQQHLVLTSDDEGGTWALESALPGRRRQFLLYESAANVLCGGDLNADGSISYQGELYMIESSFDGNVWTAKVSGSS
mgnify:CR=1 FL=1